MHPVFTTAQGQAPVTKRHLVLHIQAGLTGFLVVVVKRGRAIRASDRQPVDRVVDVAVRHGEVEDRQVVGVDALVVQADQQRVVDVPGSEVRLEVVVHGELADVFIGVGGHAADSAIVFDRAAGLVVTARGDGLERQV
ncbi:hypothetical protein D9M71_645820 [compost metagenome]